MLSRNTELFSKKRPRPTISEFNFNIRHWQWIYPCTGNIEKEQRLANIIYPCSIVMVYCIPRVVHIDSIDYNTKNVTDSFDTNFDSSIHLYYCSNI